nr:hypothetical protein [Spirochaetota bacterium]
MLQTIENILNVTERILLLIEKSKAGQLAVYVILGVLVAGFSYLIIKKILETWQGFKYEKTLK